MSDASRDGQERADRAKHDGPDRTSPYPVSRLSGAVSLVDAAREIERADQWIASTSSAKLEQIAEQMHALRQQAERVLAEARVNADLHRAEARFARHPGNTYHLYQRADGQRYWSLLSPSDWAAKPPHGFVGSYRLEADQSWTPAEAIGERDRRRKPIGDWFERSLGSGAVDGRETSAQQVRDDDASPGVTPTAEETK